MSEKLINSTGTSLKANGNDAIVSILKGLLGFVPYAGSALGEVITWTIPNQRIDRACDYLEQLASQISKISDIQDSWIEKLKSSKSNLLLFELAAKYSVETNSNILHHCYAYYVFNSINNKSMDDIQREKILKVISELNEYEIIHLLSFFSPSYIDNDSDFFQKFENILIPHTSFIEDSGEDQEFNAFFDYYKVSLEQKGLIIGKPEVKNHTLDLDKKKYSITPFGEIVAEAINDEDFFEKINGVE